MLSNTPHKSRPSISWSSSGLTFRSKCDLRVRGACQIMEPDTGTKVHVQDSTVCVHLFLDEPAHHQQGGGAIITVVTCCMHAPSTVCLCMQHLGGGFSCTCLSGRNNFSSLARPLTEFYRGNNIFSFLFLLHVQHLQHLGCLRLSLNCRSYLYE